MWLCLPCEVLFQCSCEQKYENLGNIKYASYLSKTSWVCLRRVLRWHWEVSCLFHPSFFFPRAGSDFWSACLVFVTSSDEREQTQPKPVCLISPLAWVSVGTWKHIPPNHPSPEGQPGVCWTCYCQERGDVTLQRRQGCVCLLFSPYIHLH